MPKNTNIPVINTATGDARPDTGPLQLDSDFPGVFRRGDHCFAFMMNRMMVLKELMDRIKHSTETDDLDVTCATLMLDDIEFHLQAIVGPSADFRTEERQAYRALLEYLKPKITGYSNLIE